MNVSVTMWMSLFFDVFTGTFYQMCLNVFFGDYEYCVRPAVWHCHLPQAECPPATRNQTMQQIKVKAQALNASTDALLVAETCSQYIVLSVLSLFLWLDTNVWIQSQNCEQGWKKWSEYAIVF